MKNKHPGCDGVFSCDTCHYRTVNKTYWEHHLEDHKNGLVPVVSMASAIATPYVAQSNSNIESTPAAMALPQHIYIQSSSGAPISTIDLSKLTSNTDNLGQSDMSAAQIIYSALSAISQQGSMGSVVSQAVEEGQTELHPHVDSTTEDGVTTHTITFHIGSDNVQQSGVSTPQNGEMIVAVPPHTDSHDTATVVAVQPVHSNTHTITGHELVGPVVVSQGSTDMAFNTTAQVHNTRSILQPQIIHTIKSTASDNEILITPSIKGDGSVQYLGTVESTDIIST